MAASRFARPQETYRSYYAALRFRFDERQRSGLECFFEMAQRCGVLAAAPPLAYLGELAVHA